MSSVGAALTRVARELAALAGRHPRAAAAGVAVLAGLMLLWAASRRAPVEPLGGGASLSPRASGPVAAGPQVPLVNACGLLVDADVEDALGLLSLPWANRELIEYSGGERCTWHHVRDGEDVAGLALTIGPGSQDDFASDATLEGIAGTRVTGVGAQAVWFGGADAGTLSVVDGGSLGYVFMRVVLERADTDDTERLAAALRVAGRAVPHLPGMSASLPVPEPEVVTAAAPDLSVVSLDENLLARHAAGDWTRQEGLVATLRYMLGAEGDAAVLREPALESIEGTGVIRLARDYLHFGTDEEAKSEIAVLLDRLEWSDDELEAMAGVGGPHAGAGVVFAVAGPSDRPRPLLAQVAVDCASFFEGYALPPGITQCLEWRPAADPAGNADGRYRIFMPGPGLPQAGWTEAYYQDAVEALEHTLVLLNAYGRMPPINVVFTVAANAKAGGETADHGFGRPCAVALHPNLQTRPEYFQQVLAHELVHCFTGENFPRQNRVPYEVVKWWVEGVADYFSNVAYPRVNMEWTRLGALSRYELLTTVLTRGYTNWTLYQFMANAHSDDTILALLGTLPGCGSETDPETTAAETAECVGIGSDQEAAALRAFGSMPAEFQRYTQDLTDASIQDTSRERFPFAPQSVAVQVPYGAGLAELDAFAATRMHVVVPPFHFACMDYDLTGDARSAWRRGLPGKDAIGGPWDEDLPDAVQDEAIFVATSSMDGAEFLMRVRDLVEDEADCDRDQDGSPGDGDCDLSLCGVSDFFRSPDQLADWLLRLLPPLE